MSNDSFFYAQTFLDVQYSAMRVVFFNCSIILASSDSFLRSIFAVKLKQQKHAEKANILHIGDMRVLYNKTRLCLGGKTRP